MHKADDKENRLYNFDKDKKWQIRISGTGGQGIIRAAVILAQAALYEGKNATQSQAYGPEARGGASKSEVIVSTDEIHYPKVDSPNLLFCMSSQAYQKYGQNVAPGGISLVDESLAEFEEIKAPKNVNLHLIPAIKVASEKLGNVLCANMVAIGVIVGITNMVSVENVERSLNINFKKKLIDINKKALYEGYKLGEELIFAR